MNIENRNTLIGVHLKEAYRLVLGAYQGTDRDNAEDMAREVAIDFMVTHGIITPEFKDDFGVVVGDYLQTILMMALLRYKALEDVMATDPVFPHA